MRDRVKEGHMFSPWTLLVFAYLVPVVAGISGVPDLWQRLGLLSLLFPLFTAPLLGSFVTVPLWALFSLCVTFLSVFCRNGWASEKWVFDRLIFLWAPLLGATLMEVLMVGASCAGDVGYGPDALARCIRRKSWLPGTPEPLMLSALAGFLSAPILRARKRQGGNPPAEQVRPNHS